MLLPTGSTLRDGVRIAAALTLFGVVLFQTAWLTEDAFVTFRTVDNFVHGYGLTWNVAERVQAYSNPLWMLLVIPFYWLSGEIYYTAIALSMTVSLAAFYVVILDRIRDRRTVFYLALLAALAAVNRLDAMVLFAPPLAYALWSRRGRGAIVDCCLGFTPLALWELFSLFYYGSPFPNTAYAQLATGVPLPDRLSRGVDYPCQACARASSSPLRRTAAQSWRLG